MAEVAGDLMAADIAVRTRMNTSTKKNLPPRRVPAAAIRMKWHKTKAAALMPSNQRRSQAAVATTITMRDSRAAFPSIFCLWRLLLGGILGHTFLLRSLVCGGLGLVQFAFLKLPP